MLSYKRVILVLITLALIAFVVLRHYSPHTTAPVSGPALSVSVEQSTDWTAVAAVVVSILTGIEALFSSISRLISMIRGKKNEAPSTPASDGSGTQSV